MGLFNKLHNRQKTAGNKANETELTPVEISDPRLTRFKEAIDHTLANRDVLRETFGPQIRFQTGLKANDYKDILLDLNQMIIIQTDDIHPLIDAFYITKITGIADTTCLDLRFIGYYLADFNKCNKHHPVRSVLCADQPDIVVDMALVKRADMFERNNHQQKSPTLRTVDQSEWLLYPTNSRRARDNGFEYQASESGEQDDEYFVSGEQNHFDFNFDLSNTANDTTGNAANNSSNHKTI